MKATTRRKPTTTARLPCAMLSLPRLGPTVRSSTMSMGAARAPARSRRARSRASRVDSRPVIWKRLDRGSRITAMLMTSSFLRWMRWTLPSTRRVSVLVSMKTTAMGLPTLSLVASNMARAPLPSRVMNTAGLPLCWSIPEAASMMDSPVMMIRLLRSTGSPERVW